MYHLSPTASPLTHHVTSVAIFAIIHVYYVAQWSKSFNPGIAAVYSLLWQQVELGYALMAATIPTLRSFIRGYEKAMGWESSYCRHPSGNKTTYASYQLSTINKSRHEEEEGGFQELGRENTYGVHSPLRPDRPNYKAKISGPAFGAELHVPRRTKSNSSVGSEEPIIRKEVEVQVMSESAR